MATCSCNSDGAAVKPTVRLIRGDCLAVLARLPAGSVDAVVSDPPYEYHFMSKKWDGTGVAFRPETWAAVLRVLRPGGYMLAFGGTRTFHRQVCAMEDAGWEIRDTVMWLYGQGFPKAKSCLKPSYEPITLARRPGPAVLPLPGLDGCRVGTEEDTSRALSFAGSHIYAQDDYTKAMGRGGGGHPAGRWPPNLLLSHAPGCRQVGTKRVKGTNPIGPNPGKAGYGGGFTRHAPHDYTDPDGRETVADWECVDGCPVKALGEQSGELKSGKAAPGGHKRKARDNHGVYGLGHGFWHEAGDAGTLFGDSGTAARFYPQFPAEPFLYCPKASRAERNRGCEGMEERACQSGCGGDFPTDDQGRDRDRFKVTATNFHPTVKPLAVCRWLCRLICPPGGTVLDPFCGSGTAGVAAVQEGRSFIGIEQEPQYLAIARRRIRASGQEPAAGAAS